MFDLYPATAARLGFHPDYPACYSRDRESRVHAIAAVYQPAPGFSRVVLALLYLLASLS